MKRVSGKHLAQVLERKGWTHTRTKGSHHRYEKQGHPPVTVPIHGNKTLKPKTQQNIMRHAGLTDADL
jgi:predicted RNA binding protein YcfA (HicA-like mRNA interferase family)